MGLGMVWADEPPFYATDRFRFSMFYLMHNHKTGYFLLHTHIYTHIHVSASFFKNERPSIITSDFMLILITDNYDSAVFFKNELP